jgi:NAD(P)-dependent dehydrogenase (short-subunit alcohol dehydrogenase family)
MRARHWVADLAAKCQEVGFWLVDVADEPAMKAAIDAAFARFGSQHVLVNISGSPKPTDQLTEAKWDRVQAVDRAVPAGSRGFRWQLRCKSLKEITLPANADQSRTISAS